MQFLTRLFGWAIGLAAALVALLFVIESREPVTLSVWGVPDQIQVPLFLAVLGAWLVGFFCGAIVMWFCDGRSRRLGRSYLSELHQARKEVDDLKGQLTAMRQAADAADQARAAASSGMAQIGGPIAPSPARLPGRAA
jgi:putative membrane protein